MLRAALIATGFTAALSCLAGCETERVYECTVGQSSECSRSGQFGDCLAPGFCAFSDSSCAPTGLRWDSTAGDGLAGQCVTNGGDGGALNACSGTTTLPGLPGQRCGICDSGTYACDGTEAVRCDGEVTLEQNVTTEPGSSVTPSSEFDGNFLAGLAIDGDLSTSWFSAGSQNDGTESTYTWTGASEQCIVGITFIGNEFHANSSFRENFGFGQVTFEVLDDDDTVVFSKVESLAGTPDPELAIDTGGALGRSVRLRLQGHESNDCGGFAEMTVSARR